MSRELQPISPKELYRRLTELTARVFEEGEGSEAARLVSERVVEDLGGRLGIASVRRVDASAGVPEVDGMQVLCVETAQGPELLQFDLTPDAEPTQVELVVSVLTSILSTKLLERCYGDAMRQAVEIQRSFLPQAPPPFEGYEIGLRSVPAEGVGGDLHDFLTIDEDTLGIAIGDASGHGLPAALLVRDVVVGLRMGMKEDLRPAQALQRLNNVIHASSLSRCFVSLFYAELEHNGNLFFFNAGHEPPMLLGADTTIATYSDTVIGPLTNARFKRQFAHIDRGATLVLHTDGLVERRNKVGDLLGVEALTEAIRAKLDRPVEEIVEHVFSLAAAFANGRPQEDDATLLIVRRLP